MKRSEMVSLMADAFVCYQENDGIKDLIRLMDKVLKTCEEEGMQPPAVPVTGEEYDCGLTDKYHYWEVE